MGRFILDKLKRSKFRGAIHLNEFEMEKVIFDGLEKVGREGYEILDKRVRVLRKNDGKQTPWKGHPVFIAQHATATCCRKCIEKWHKIPKEKVLEDVEMKYLLNLILVWLEGEVK